EQWRYLEDTNTILFRRGEDIEQTLLKSQPIGDHQVGTIDTRHLRRRRLEVMGIGAGRHQNLDSRFIPDDVAHHIPEDGGGDHDPETVGRSASAATPAYDHREWNEDS